ncbi:Wzz/FepE/Etk N-terminal domain-containing protein [Pseudomonas sp. HR96]|uniref:Wzz/FepE/Etk N-terminal domain-containing protein n=1 Tax=Pseudomonas sp. HR96 TaxID=1027966 RepID=UPI002A75754A|nr:Wzz/FepE/Etk N-terminal domain-containing protein [Pseudomonas sp. HR96]WPP00343.1 Wzz/FepE/Etk N-terminal domain-containing protein [Pseudomonas sp. HR96]
MNRPTLAQLMHGVRVVLANKFLVILGTGVFAALGWGYTQLAQPIYEARALVQVTQTPGNSLAGQVAAQIALMQSPDAVGKVLQAQNLDVDYTVAHLTLIGNFFARHFQPTPAQPLAAPLLGMATYGWGGEVLDIQQLDVPIGLMGQTLTLVAGDNGHYTLYAPQRVLLLAGQVGQIAQANDVTILIRKLVARPGTLLYTARKRPQSYALEYIERMQVSKGPPGSGLIYVALQDTRPDVATRVLDGISRLDAGGAKVIDSATTDTYHPAYPRSDLIIGLCALFGLLLSLAVVIRYKVLAVSAKGPDAIEGIGLPVLASLPWSQRQKRLGARSPLLCQVARDDLAVEALRSLRTSLYMTLLGAPDKAVLLCGMTPDAGTSFITSNLAVVLAQGGQRVLLVDANLRSGRLHEELMVKPTCGLSDVLAARADARDLVHYTGIAGLDLVARGRKTANSAALFSAGSIEGLLHSWAPHYDVILIDAPALSVGPDARLLGRQVGSVLLVARMNKYSLSEIDACRQRLAHEGVPVRGAVFNGEVLQQVARTAHVADTYGYSATPQRK